MNAEQLCHELGTGLLRAAVLPDSQPGARAVVVCGTPEEAALVDRGDLVLAVGAETATEQAGTAAAAANAGAAGVVVKGRAPAPVVASEASRLGVALLLTDPDVAWGRLYELVVSALRPARGSRLLASGGVGGDLFALADQIAAVCGAPVTIEDPASRLLAFSREGQEVDEARVATILGRRVPGEWASRLHQQAELDGVLAGDEPGVIEVPGMAPRRVIAIRSTEVRLGSIWLAGPTDASADDALREGAAVAALQLLRRRAEQDLEYAARSAALTRLLQTGELTDLTAAETGFRAEDALAVVALALEEPEGEHDPAPHDQLAELLAVHLRAFRRRAAHVALDGRGYVVAACAPGDSDPAKLTARLQDGWKRVRSAAGTDAAAGLGVIAEEPAALPVARETADRALTLGASRPEIVAYEEVRAMALVEDVRAFVMGRPDGRSVELRTLLEHDRVHGTELAATLLTVLDLFGDTSSAAARLHVHANTVRYRLRQAAELTGVRLDDGTARLALELELRAQSEDEAGGA